MPVIVVTRLRLWDPALLDEFFTDAVAAIERAMKSDGNLGADALAGADSAWRSVSARQERRLMQAYLDSEPHLGISARLDHYCDEATFVDWEQASPRPVRLADQLAPPHRRRQSRRAHPPCPQLRQRARGVSSWLCGQGGIMTQPPETRIEPAVAAAPHRDRLLSPARYRHPGDVVRLIIAGFVLAGMLTLTAAIHGTYAGASATAVSAVAPSTLPGRVLAGLVQAVFVAAAAVAVVVTWRSRRYRLLLGLAGSAVLASAVVVWIIELAGGQRPPTLTAGTGPWPWLTGASLAGPALGAAAVAGTGFVVLGTVYLGTATVAAATPTPGGVGGFEAAAIVGLTGVGIANGPAVSAVVVYRLATYWLPVVPGLLAWRVSQRRGYV